MKGNAVFSRSETYRYLLTRRWGPDKTNTCLWIMLNPSTATATKNDATIRRCIRFAQAWGHDGIAVVNLYAYRATAPRDLWRALHAGTNIVGKHNDHYIDRAILRSKDIICAWGGNADFRRPKEVLSIIHSLERPAYCLGTTTSGQPLHPLRLGSWLTPVLYEGRPIAAVTNGQTVGVTTPALPSRGLGTRSTSATATHDRNGAG